MTIWFETDDLFVHFDWNLQPTGIQRVALAILAAAQARHADKIGFCRLSRHGQLIPIGFMALMNQCPGATARRASAPWRAVRFITRHPARRFRDHVRRGRDARAIAGLIVPGDVLVCLGLPWKRADYGARIAAAKRRHGLRFVLLIHDVLPLTEPRFFAPAFIASFARWFDGAVPACDKILVGSAHVGDKVRSVCAARGLSLPPIERISFGAGFAVTGAGSPPSFAPEPFVLYVSTIGGRKNHALLLRVWRRLIGKHGVGSVPALVFVGTGEHLGAVRGAIESGGLSGKVVIATAVGDAELRELYRRCLVTVYPSFTEGWGLPIAESLTYGKFCVASHGGALPEIGGDLIDYFDPADDDDATAKIERALFDRDYLAMRTARVAATYRAPSWETCATSVLRTSA
ncbi:MAG: glycosyltransferase [Stellaceae bacterium]